MRIIRAYFPLSNITLWKVASWTTMRIIRGMRISEGQIIRATLYYGMPINLVIIDNVLLCVYVCQKR